MILFLTFWVVACGGGKESKQNGLPPVETPMYAAQQVFPLAAGQQWDMMDGGGNLTHFSVTAFGPQAGCRMGEFLNLNISKSSEQAYWHPGTPRMEITDWVLKKEQGTWKFATFYVNEVKSGGTSTWQLNSESNVWLVNPGSIGAGQTMQTSTDLTYFIVINADLRKCMSPGEVQVVGNPEKYLITETIEIVSTPVYSGPALAADYCEIDLPVPTRETTPSAELCNRAHEKWWFAPEVGVVQIEIMPSSNVGPNSDGVTGYVTKRIN